MGSLINPRRGRCEQAQLNLMARLCTIGYADLTPESLISVLRSSGVLTLVDVRANASSRKPGFSKRKLEEKLVEAGIEYRHEPSLGIPTAERKAASGNEGWTALISDYRKSLDVPNLRNRDAITLAELVKQRPIALMCLESDLDHCHRKPLAEWVSANTGQEVEHL